ncbi:MAG: hypothetical protein ABEI74_02350 [Candidatus Pacearchaeota archaeon]
MAKKRFDLKEKPNYEFMKNFSLGSIPDLDTCVLGALEMFSSEKLEQIKIPKHKRMIVVGSGNALAAGRIIFEKQDAVFASESDYKKKLKETKFDLGVVVSASGKKHAPRISKKLSDEGLKTVLITNNSSAPAKKYVDKAFTLPKQREPYTYNTSTYLSMIFAREGEKPEKIYNHLEEVDKKLNKDFSKYESYFLVVPSKFDSVREMLVTKFDELFGPKINGRVYTEEQIKHAKTVIKDKKELFISFGVENKNFGYKSNRLEVPLPNKAGFGAMIATAYYVIGKIQKSKEPWFKENIKDYTEKISKIFNQKIKSIVE